MTTNFPASLDTSAELPRDVGVNDTLADRVHHTLHNNLSDAVLKIEAVLGAGWSTSTTLRAEFISMQSTISSLSGSSLPRAELTGTILIWSGLTAPSGWQLCDGSAISRSTYAALFAITSTRFGAGNGTTTFNVPDLRGRFPVGYDSGNAPFNVFGRDGIGGSKEVTLTPPQMPAHNHYYDHYHTGVTNLDGAHRHNTKGVNGANIAGSGYSYMVQDDDNVGSVWTNSSSSEHQHAFATSWATVSGASKPNTDNAGSDQGHPNLPPYLPINFIIKT